MCLPCWPWADVYLEDEPKKKSKGKETLYLDPVSRTLVKLTNTTVQSVPLVYQQPVYPQQPQPVYYNPGAHPQQVHYNNPSGAYMMNPAQSIPGAYPNYAMQQPPLQTFGMTGNEVLGQQLLNAKAEDMNAKQEMKPADDDPARMYWCRELDGTWTQRNRMTIDSGDIGDCRWYAKDGAFYAVRLPNA